MADDLKTRLVNRLKQVGAFDVRIADPKVGFEHALPGMHPIDLWKECQSIISFATPMSPKTNNMYLGPYAPFSVKNRNIGPIPRDIQTEMWAMDRLSRLFTSSVTLKGMTFLSENGCDVSFKMPQMKLSAYETGIGVYGSSGVTINPILGNRYNLGAIMTNAVLEPDGRLHGFDPCKNCDLCLKACPAKAFDPTKSYPESYDRVKCMAKRAEIEAKGLYCHNCFAICPAGKFKDEELLSIQEAASFLKRDRL